MESSSLPDSSRDDGGENELGAATEQTIRSENSIEYVYAMKEIRESKRFVHLRNMYAGETCNYMHKEETESSESVLTMSFPTWMLSEYRELGFMF